MLTSLDWLAVGMPWPVKDHDTMKRWKRAEACRDLYASEHPEWLRDEREPDKRTELRILVDFYGRLSRGWADLQFGEPPRISHDGQREGEYMASLVSHILPACYTAALDVSALGDGLLRARLVNGRAVIAPVMPETWVPIFDPEDSSSIVSHVLVRQTDCVVQGEVGRSCDITAEVHEAGIVRMFVGHAAGGMITRMQEVPAGSNGAESGATGATSPLVFHVPNGRTSACLFGTDDYKAIDPLLDEMAARYTLNSLVLDKHSDPNMAAPMDVFTTDPSTGETTLRISGEVYPIGQDGATPSYITWDGNLTPSAEQIRGIKEELYLVSETCAAMFGDNKNGPAASGAALKRQMMSPLAKVNRLRTVWDAAIKECITATAALESFYRLGNAVPLPDPQIEWRDGLPEDETERATVDTMYVTAGLMSMERALRRQGLDGAADDPNSPLGAELARLQAETPKVATGPAPRVTLQTFNQ